LARSPGPPVHAGSGQKWTADMLIEAAVRLRTIERAFNYRRE